MSSQGQSAATIDKERRIGSALALGMSVAAGKFADRGFRYFHLDANAGSGWNEEFDVPGSPSVFWLLAQQYLKDMPIAGFFAEHDPGRAKQLVKAVPDNYARNTFIFARDNENVLDVFIEFVRNSGERLDYVVGSVICDPNNWFYRNAQGEGPPILGLSRLAVLCPRIDLILNLNARTYRLQKSQGHRVSSPLDIMHILNKDHWLIGYAHRGANDFMLIVGRNFLTGGHRALGLYPVDSDEGRHILNLVEGKRQGDLFRGA